MEYAFFTGNDFADQLVIIGPGDETIEIKQYLKTLEKKISVPIFYKKITS